MKFGQLIECSMRKIVLGKSYAKCGGEASPRAFSKKLKFTISLEQWSKVLHSFFLFYDKLRAFKIYWK